MSPVILPVTTAQDLDDVRALLTEYAETLDVLDRCFQNMDAELAALPGEYTPPHGALLVARDEAGAAVGCIALHGLGDGLCEMKRLYVRPSGQGRGLGRRLAQAVIGLARDAGYRALRLDTLETMHAAQALYRDLGFETIPAYNANPVPGIVYFELRL
jgi:ribosomal protein S18 acetylase RimI-like enzyme